MRIFYLKDKRYLNPPYIKILGQDVHHISKVLRHRIGDEIHIRVDKVTVYRCCIKKITKNHIDLEIINSEILVLEKKIDVTLCHALTKAKSFSIILQKATELGVSSIIPFKSSRSIIDIKEEQKKILHWEKILLQASNQSNQVEIPTLHPIISSFSELNSYTGVKLIAYEKEDEWTLKKRLSENQNCNKLMVCIGPEGGFSENEIKQAIESDFKTFSLGNFILRTETATIVTLGNINFYFS